MIAAENLELMSQLEGAPEREALEQQARALSEACFGKVHLAEGHVMVVGESFATLADAAPELAGLRAARFLDVILLHEAVHVWQDRRFDVDAFVGKPRDEEELRGRFCVLEGHAQVVTRRVAERLGLTDEFALFVRANGEVPSTITDPVLRLMAETTTKVMGFQYVDGERFVAHVLERLGPEAGLERLFTAPPRTLRAVSHPELYLDPPADDGLDLRAIAGRAAELLPEGWPRQVVAVPEPGLRTALALGGEEAEAWLKDGHRETMAVVGGDPQVANRQLTLALYACTSPEAATRFITVSEAVSRAKDEQYSKPGSAFTIVSTSTAGADLDDRPGLFMDKRVATPVGEITVRSLVVAEGAFVVELVSVHHDELDKAGLQDLARRVLALLPAR